MKTKKLTALLLSAAMCFSLCGCDSLSRILDDNRYDDYYYDDGYYNDGYYDNGYYDNGYNNGYYDNGYQSDQRVPNLVSHYIDVVRAIVNLLNFPTVKQCL